MQTAGIVLAGGAARRMSGVDKPMLRLGGMSMLHRAIAALADTEPVIVVGPRRHGLPPVRWTREDPPGGGPVAALAAGLALVPPDKDVVVVLAADLPGLAKSTVDKVVAALGAADGAVLADAGGHRQWLIGAWRTARLRAALPAAPAGASLRNVLGGLSIAVVPAAPGESDDVDTPADLARHQANSPADDGGFAEPPGSQPSHHAGG